MRGWRITRSVADAEAAAGHLNIPVFRAVLAKVLKPPPMPLVLLPKEFTKSAPFAVCSVRHVDDDIDLFNSSWLGKYEIPIWGKAKPRQDSVAMHRHALHETNGRCAGAGPVGKRRGRPTTMLQERRLHRANQHCVNGIFAIAIIRTL